MRDELSDIDREWNQIALEAADEVEVELLDEDELEILYDSEL